MTLRLKLKNCKFTMFNLKAGQADEFHGHEDVYQLSIPLAGKSIMQHEQTRRHMESPDSRMLLSPGQQHRHLAEDKGARILLITVKRDFLRRVVADRLQGFENEVFFDPWGQNHSSGILIQQVEQSFLRSLQHPLDGMELEEFEWKLVSFMLSVHQGTHSDKWFPSSPPPLSILPCVRALSISMPIFPLPSPWTICAKSRESANIISFACSKNMSEPHRANISGIKDYNWLSSCFVIPEKTSSPSLWSPGSTAFLNLNGRLEKSSVSARPGIAKGYLLKVGLSLVLVTPEASPVTAKNRIITDETSNKPKEVCKEPISATRPISTGPTIKDKYPAPVTMETERASRPGVAWEASENETGATGERAIPTPSNPQAAKTGLDVDMTTAIPTEAMNPLKIKIRLSPAFSIKAELLNRPIIAEKCKDAMPIPPNSGPD
jgi:quercetin dioxygenase-like cupin family protein